LKNGTDVGGNGHCAMLLFNFAAQYTRWFRGK
jgi:hypothetical protein